MNKALILGGARSGKSAYAEQLSLQIARSRNAGLVYIATAQAWDDEMRRRIEAHQARRAAEWRLVDAPRDLGEAIKTEARTDSVILIDCLTLWLTNEMLAYEESPGLLQSACSVFLSAYREAEGVVICVSNELGLGLVPETALGRAFRDAQGRLNQDTAAIADHAAFVVAGLPMTLKGDAPI